MKSCAHVNQEDINLETHSNVIDIKVATGRAHAMDGVNATDLDRKIGEAVLSAAAAKAAGAR